MSVLVLCAPTPALAQVEGDILREIVVEGAQRIEPETIRTYLKIREGQPYDSRLVDESLKSLFATGLFADVSMRRQADTLVIVLVENPIINQVAFEGNKRIEDKNLENEVQLKPRTVYTRTKVQSDVRRILELYRRSGRFSVSVEPKVIQRDQNRIDLVFEISEGPPTYVRRINFIGNRAFTDSSLRETILTKEERWYRFMGSVDTYDPDRLTFDRELLRRHYLQQGYADFRVVSAVAELTPDQRSFFITFTIDEGERYQFGKITVEANLPQLEPEQLMEDVPAATGDWYNANLVEDSIQNITARVGQLGYAFVDVRPRVNRDQANRTIDLTFDVQEGPRVFVERIDITGNVRTLDKVIRREFRLVEGDAFNAAKLRRSQQRIRNLGFFQKVDVTNVPSMDAPDKTVVKVNVEEQSTGDMSLGVGYSSANGAMFDVGIRERNLLGKGQDLKAKVSLAQNRTQIDFGFTEPYFLDRELAAGVDAFVTTTNLQSQSSYSTSSRGGALRLGFSYNENLQHSLRYSGRTLKVQNVNSNASEYIKREAGTTVLSSVSHVLTYDTRDSRFKATSGRRITLSNELAGLGGTEKFFQTDVGIEQNYGFWDDWTVLLRGDVGVIAGLGQNVRVSQRYFLGGDNLRGFEGAGATARDRNTKDALGGDWMATASAQLNFPVGLPNELGISGRLFTDMGAIGSPGGIPAADIWDAQTLRMSVGFGVAWRSPMGPMSFDFGFPVMKEAFDREEIIRFNFGSRF